jgi:hypothetical protein
MLMEGMSPKLILDYRYAWLGPKENTGKALPELILCNDCSLYGAGNGFGASEREAR